MFVGLKSFGYSMLSKTLPRAWKRSELSASCTLRLALMMSVRPQWNRLPLPCYSHSCCCCDLPEGQELDLLVVGHLWGDDYSQLPDSLSFFGSVVPAAVDAGGLRGYGLLEVLLLR